MILAVLAFLGGALTIVSPCILPVLPFIFSTSDQPFRKSGLPLLLGMALTFAGVASLTVVGGSWIVQASQWGRYLALGVLSLLAATLLSPSLAEHLTRPFLRLGSTLQRSSGEGRGVGASVLLGVATGFLWAPCAGPILGLVFAGAALQSSRVQTSGLLLAYALGAATSLAMALLVGGRALQAMRHYLGMDVWVRRFLGLAVLAGVAAGAFGWDRGVLTRLSRLKTENLEERLLATFHRSLEDATPPAPPSDGRAPLSALQGATGWMNSPALTADALKGKVVLIDFWTYSCINCLRTLPYVKAWAERYKANGLVVIGVHTPEFAFEKDARNVAKAIQELGVTYPVVLDNDYGIWNAFHNRYWPAHYFIDATGQIRHQHFGEGEYDESEQILRQLLNERASGSLPPPGGSVAASGALAPSDGDQVDSPETYIGYGRAENLRTLPALRREAEESYRIPATLALNEWGLEGRWRVQEEKATLTRAPGIIRFRFQARDVHLVMGATQAGKPVRYRVTLDGQAPGAGHGADTDASGQGVVQGERLYQLLRLTPAQMPGEHTIEIEFLDPGLQAFAFTFG